MMERDELAGWLRLALTPGLGRAGMRRLLASFGLPEAIFDAPPDALRAVLGSDDLLRALARPPQGLDDLLGLTERWLSDARASIPRRLLTLGDGQYPQRLLHTADPPVLLYVEGAVEALQAPLIAIVGSRHPTPQGLDHARAFAQALSAAGHPVVSGLALGIDGAAHEGSLQGGQGTVGVVGTGLDQVYPRRHAALARRLLEDPRSALVSEYPVGTPPLPPHFPQRNRIIAGLSLGTLVVEAAPASGSLITARLASEAGREVFAIPGSIQSPQSRGCHALIRQGATLVESAEDVLADLGSGLGLTRRAALAVVETVGETPGPTVASAPPSDTDRLLSTMGHDPVSLDALVARTGEAAATLSARLLTLELEGRVARLPGQLFQRRGLG